MQKARRLTALCLASLLLAAAFTGCSNKAEDSPTAGSAANGAKSIPTYKLGLLAPITGTNAEYGAGFQVATQMAVDEINAKGEMKLEIVVKDSKGDTKESADLARQFGDDSSVMAIIGDFTSSCCMANAPIVDEAGIVQLSPTASNPKYASMSKYCFSIMGRQDGEAPFFSTYLLKKYAGATNVGIIWVNSDWGKSAHDNFTKQAEADGLKVVADVNYVADEKDFSSAIAKLRSAKPDHIVIMDQGAVPTIINQISAANWTDVKITTLGPGTSPQLLTLAGKNAEGLLLSTPFMIDATNAKAKKWSEDFTAKAGFGPTVHPACAYDCVYLIEAAIKASGSTVTRDSIRDNLQDLKGFTGLTGPIQFNKDRDITRKYLVVSVDNGQYAQRTNYDYATQ